MSSWEFLNDRPYDAELDIKVQWASEQLEEENPDSFNIQNLEFLALQVREAFNIIISVRILERMEPINRIRLLQRIDKKNAQQKNT